VDSEHKGQPATVDVTESKEGHIEVAEFFAGIGLARLGLERAGAKVVWANDFNSDKKTMYEGHFGIESTQFVECDIAAISAKSLPDFHVAWASFPCIDLSLAGWRRGLQGEHSSAFWQFTRILTDMEDRRPPVVVLENVIGFATSHGGKDLTRAVRELNQLGYSVDVLTLDARRFVPQSRPRLFLVGALEPPTATADNVSELRPEWLQTPFDDAALTTHRALLPLPPPLLTEGLEAVVEIMRDDDERWWDARRTENFLSSLSSLQAERLKMLKDSGRTAHRTAYRRTRQGKPVWEMRPDDISGCLRTARGGSSKQAVVQVQRESVRVRWMTPLEYGRLMGAGEYNLEGVRTNQALFGFGDAVCVPAVAWLAREYVLPLVKGEVDRKNKLQPQVMAS
jgi:DNA (cytosine-5)-methyltransferase 1